MEKTWRWFGPADKITLSMLRQIGVEGIVTALHQYAPGELWPEADIRALQDYIAAAGLRWSVVESLPVSEEIKYAGPNRDALIETYKQSLANLGRCGIHTICYNFMPVIDWAVRFAYFDIKILKREGAEKDFPQDVLEQVEALDRTITDAEKAQLVDTLIVKTQGFVNGPLGDGDGSPVAKFRALMEPYKGITRDQLRENLRYFLEAIMPVCRKWDMRMCVHPDDPPMQIFGLPRIVCSAEDIRWMLDAVDDFHNGVTFCAGSLSAGAHNDVEAMAREFAPRTHFVHLRTCNLLPGGNFVEAPHTDGRVDLVELIRIFEREGRDLPMRVDHGRTMLGDETRGYNAGYSFHGRMLALGQVSGMMAAVQNELKKEK